jgi:diguanylate cyclase (GGDEF)-like protein
MITRNQRLILILSIVLVAGFLVTSLASFFVSRASLRAQISQSTLPLTSDNLYSEIQRDLLLPIHISSLMATDTFLRDWILDGEGDSEKVIKYLKGMQIRYDTLTSFLVSDKTLNYYQSEMILKQVDQDEPRDEWYFRVRDMEDDYEINVDYDMAHADTMAIFVNYRVYDYEDRYIGATGVGLAVTTVKRLIESYQLKYGRSIYFVDSHGAVTLHGSSFPAGITNIHDMESLAPVLDQVFSHEHQSLDYLRDGKRVYLNTRYLPEFDWYLFVEQTDETVIRGILRTLVLNLLICMVITLIVLMSTGKTVSSYQRRMEKMATIDTLTGLLNRNAFDVILDQTIRESRRNDIDISIIWFDIDHFKRVNDTYGHMAGDAMLKLISQRCVENLRESDIICRWGGEEFIILLKECGLDNAFAMSEELRVIVSGSTLQYEGNEISVSTSLGVAHYSTQEKKTEFLTRADKAMYRAKESGRNLSMKA